MTFNRLRLGVSYLALLTLAVLTSAVPSVAQQTLGSLNGTVLDASGAAVPQATVTATSAGTDLERSTKTGNTGFWQILDLPIGNYKVTVTHDGYQTETLPKLLVQEGRATTVDASLKVGQGL